MITLTWDSKQLKAFERVPRGLLSALRRAGSDAARAMKAESSRLVRARKKFKVAKVNQSLPLTFPSAGAPIHRLVWRMDVSGQTMPLSAFPARQTRKGVVVQVNAGSPKLFKSAFLATMKSGHTGVFYRQGAARLPIDEAFSTRISDVFHDEGMIPAVQARAQSVFASAFARLLPQELKR